MDRHGYVKYRRLYFWNVLFIGNETFNN